MIWTNYSQKMSEYVYFLINNSLRTEILKNIGTETNHYIYVRNTIRLRRQLEITCHPNG